MRVFVSCPLDDVSVALHIARELRAAGHEVVSRWHDVVKPGDRDPVGLRERRAALGVNHCGLDRAEALVVWTATGTPRATLCEVGWAIAKERDIVWLVGEGGRGRNLYCSHPLVTEIECAETAPVETMAAVLAALAEVGR